jgi:hypothetical protein
MASPFGDIWASGLQSGQGFSAAVDEVPSSDSVTQDLSWAQPPITRVSFRRGRSAAATELLNLLTDFDEDPFSAMLPVSTMQLPALEALRAQYFEDLKPQTGRHQRTESVEMQWLVENSELLNQYAGEWLLIVGQTLAAHSRDYQSIKAVIAQRQLLSPFVYYVPKAEESNWMGI